jgi:hypothetical protein
VWALAGALVAVCAAETTLRLRGYTDVPIYEAGGPIGFQARANQHGKAAGKYAWAFNDRGLAVQENWSPGGVLLIGNSIITRDNSTDQSQRLGPLLAKAWKQPVWPIAAPGWSTLNEMAWLDANKDVVAGSSSIVWEVVPEQLCILAPWPGESARPTHRPLSAIGFVLVKWLKQKFPALRRGDVAKGGPINPDAGARFEHWIGEMTAAGKRVTILIYAREPDRQKFRAGVAQPDRDFFLGIAKKYRVALIDLYTDPRWDDRFYRDQTHQTSAGNDALLKILSSDALHQASAQ